MSGTDSPGMAAHAPHARRALVLAGGMALGAFEAGAYAALEGAGEAEPDTIVAASAGAVNAAIIAGNPPGARAAALRRYWEMAATDPQPAATFLLGPPPAGPWRSTYNEASALQTLMLGNPRLFRPRLSIGPRIGAAPALFDLEPLLARLPDFIDFDRLNRGACRVALVATDVESGDRVVLDTARGQRIDPVHIVASSALLPVFAPVMVEGRLLGDGGLASNAALDLVLDASWDRALECLVIDLFARQGSRPNTLGASIARAGDLAFGNQTQRLLEGQVRARRLLSLTRRLAARLRETADTSAEITALLEEADVAQRGHEHPVTLVRIAYRAGLDEAGPLKLFDFSKASLADRWAAGEAAARVALERLRSPSRAVALAEDLLLHEVEAPGVRPEATHPAWSNIRSD